VDVDSFDYTFDWPLAGAVKEAKDNFYRMTIGEDIEKDYETEADLVESDEKVRAWLVASLPFSYLSYKQLRRIVDRVYRRLIECELSAMVEGRLGLVKFPVRDRIERWMHEQIDAQTEAAFSRLFDAGKICFYLECADCRFPIPESVQIRSMRPLTHDDGSPIAKSLFDYVEHESQNEYERAVALVIDKHADVLWWFRNRVGPENFAIQGYRRNRIYPDYVVQSTAANRPNHQVIVVESKGAHLEGNPDTSYKRKVAGYFERAGRKVTWQQLGADFKDHVFRFQVLDEKQDHGGHWSDKLNELLSLP